MALSKIFEKDNGIVTSYHKVSSVNLTDGGVLEDNKTKILNLEIQVTSFLNELYRKTDNPIEINDYFVEIRAEEEMQTPIRELAYIKLKTMPVWENATDC